MELRRFARGSSKAQLMTLIMLILFMLMLAVLFALAQLNITSNSVVQSIVLSTASNNYGTLLRTSANGFAKESLNRAMATLTTYEYNALLRKGNFISNLSFYASNLMMSGVLPNDTSGYPQNSMGNLTFMVYANSIVANVLGFDSQNVVVSSTRPVIFQTDPYSIRASYIENISINASGSKYQYNIPVNVSVQLNNTPDLFYAEQGILRPIRLTSLYNITDTVGGVSAATGNTQSFAYGTVFVIPSSAMYSANCLASFVPTQFATAAFSHNIIIATYNAMSLTPGTCIDNYAGLITYAVSTPPANVPYLKYPASSNVLKSMTNGTKVLLYGPGLATIDIENLRSAITNHNYFASPFAASYIDRANAQFFKQSPNGIFTFSNYDTQAATSNGIGYVTATVPTITTTAGKYNTVNFWMYWNGNIATVPAPFGFSSYTLYFPSATCFGFDMGAAGGYGFNPTTANIVNKWVMVTAVFYNGYYTSNSLLYINGTQVKSLTQCQGSAGTATASSSLRLGSWGGAIGHSFMQNSGSLANFQVYNSLLTPSQIQQLYIQGISGVPVSTNSLAGWWPLNGDASEGSGNSDATTTNAISYVPLVNYVRDSALTYPVATPLSPIPGVLSCTSSLVCGGNTIPELFLGYMPLASQGGAQTGYFDGVSTDVRINSLKHAPAITSSGGSVTLAAWAYSLDLNAGFRPIISYNEYNTPRLMLAYDSYCGSADVLSILYLSGTVDFDDCLPPAITTNTWIFYAVTYNGAGGKAVTYEGVGGKLYSDSVSYYSLYGNTIPANPPIDLGSSGGWYGGISNVQVYSAALSANQMRTLYYQGIDGMPFLGNLIGWWPLNGNANDSSGNGDVTWLQTGLTFPSIQGTYDSPGLSTVASPANEWQAIGLANT